MCTVQALQFSMLTGSLLPFFTLIRVRELGQLLTETGMETDSAANSQWLSSKWLCDMCVCKYGCSERKLSPYNETMSRDAHCARCWSVSCDLQPDRTEIDTLLARTQSLKANQFIAETRPLYYILRESHIHILLVKDLLDHSSPQRPLLHSIDHEIFIVFPFLSDCIDLREVHLACLDPW